MLNIKCFKKLCHICTICAVALVLSNFAFADDEDIHGAGTEYNSCDVDALHMDPENLSATFEAQWEPCPEDHYCVNGVSNECPQDFPKSDEGTSDQGRCYRLCSIEAGDFDEYTLDGTGRVYADGERTCQSTSCYTGYEVIEANCGSKQVDLEYVNSLDHTQVYSTDTCTYGTSFWLPSAPSTIPDGKVFAGWKLVVNEPENNQ